MFRSNSYARTGTVLLVTGVLVSAIAYFVLSLTWLTALGISMLILSFVLLSLSRTIPRLPPEVCSLLLQTGMDNMATIIEELGIKGKAVYLPSSLAGGRPQALIPLHSNPTLPHITRALPERFIVRHGGRPDDVGLLLSTVGSAAFRLLETRPGPTSHSLEAALTTLLAGTLGVAGKIRVASRENHLTVEVHDPRLEDHAGWHHECLGGPIASIVASVAAEAWDKPIVIKQETKANGNCTIELEVAGENLQ